MDEIDDEERWKEVCSLSGMALARIIEGKLLAEDIPVSLKYEAAGVIYAITIDGLGEVKVMVPERLWEKARDVLAESFDEKDIDWERSAE